jgi:hypothetical protein
MKISRLRDESQAEVNIDKPEAAQLKDSDRIITIAGTRLKVFFHVMPMPDV